MLIHWDDQVLHPLLVWCYIKFSKVEPSLLSWGKLLGRGVRSFFWVAGLYGISWVCIRVLEGCCWSAPVDLIWFQSPPEQEL